MVLCKAWSVVILQCIEISNSGKNIVSGNTYSGISARSPSTMLYTPQNILPHLQQYRIPRISIQVHYRLNQLRPERVTLSGSRGLASPKVVYFRGEPVLTPDAVVVVDYTHCCVAFACKTMIRVILLNAKVCEYLTIETAINEAGTERSSNTGKSAR